MAEIIDARGLSCPQPVVLTKKALDQYTEIMVIVDDDTALDNIKRLASGRGCTVHEEREGKDVRIRILRGDDACSLAVKEAMVSGPNVVVVSSDIMGRGEDKLGSVLMKSFLHTLTEAAVKPDTMIFFNTGVKLTAQGSEVLDDLKILSDAGVRILVCGTCLNYFELKDKLRAGAVSNMYDISQAMLEAGRLVQI